MSFDSRAGPAPQAESLNISNFVRNPQPIAPLDIILTGFTSGRLSAVQACQELTRLNLWPEREELLLTLAMGRLAAHARLSFARADPSAAKSVCGLLRNLEHAGKVDYHAREFVESLCAVGDQ